MINFDWIYELIIKEHPNFSIIKYKKITKEETLENLIKQNISIIFIKKVSKYI